MSTLTVGTCVAERASYTLLFLLLNNSYPTRIRHNIDLIIDIYANIATKSILFILIERGNIKTRLKCNKLLNFTLLFLHEILIINPLMIQNISIIVEE